ncbi:Nickel uptake substrate-specific transmembrane region [Planctomycetes bacterium Poly30]|uniref:Nickel uptake substrate-specific transmembrane region n=1 Tax=Saltatorellus ferox TaxID=2528018 RepID=A0A518EW59_9BACT|nr:Nickel uptake substrate-specific transmembrane region [Planctomycetes bacterium Poly30]
MKSILALVAVLAVAGLLLLAPSRSGSENDALNLPASPEVSTGLGESALTALRSPNVAARGERAPVQGASGAEPADAVSPELISVTVRGEDGLTGEPLPGAPFHYRKGSESCTGSLGPDGTAQLEVQPGTRLYAFRLMRTEAYAGSKPQAVSTTAGDKPEVVLQSLVGGVLEGVVVDAQGESVPGSEVLVWNYLNVQTDPDAVAIADLDGSFSIPHVGPAFVASARTETLAGVRGLRGEIDATTRCEGLKLVVGPTEVFEGTVLGAADAPLEGAHLKLSSGLNSRSSRDSTSVHGITTFRNLGGAVRENFVTEADGAFRLEGEPKGHIQVRVEAPGHVGDWLTFETKESPVTIQLDQGLVLRGQVLLPGGQPAEGALVRYSPAPTNTGVQSNKQTTGADGAFTLTGFDPEDRDEAFMTVCLEGHAVAGVEPPVFDSGQGESNVVQLEAAQPLAGIVRHPNGEPAANVRIEVDGGGRFEAYNPFVGETRTFESAAGVETVQTDSNGHFTFLYRRKGAAKLKVWPTSDRQKWINVEVPSEEDHVEITLDPALARKVVLLGVVVDAASGEPIPKVALLPWISSSATGYALDTDEGAFELTGLEPGRMKIEINAEGYADQEVIEKDFANGDHDLGTIRLQPAVHASLLVVDLEGAPWTSGGLRVLDARGEVVMLKNDSGMQSNSQQLHGKPLHLRGIPSGPVTVRVTAEGADQDVAFDLSQIPDGEIARITVERPEPPPRASLVLIPLRRTALESPEEFIADLQAALDAKDQAKLARTVEALVAAGPREDITIRAVSKEGYDAGATVSWNPETADFSTSSHAVTSRSTGSSTSTSSDSPHIPFPFVQLTVPVHEGAVEFEVFQGKTKVLTQTVTIDTSESDQPIILCY